jgi:hypothetical protein
MFVAGPAPSCRHDCRRPVLASPLAQHKIGAMPTGSNPKRKLTDAERHARFVEPANEVEAEAEAPKYDQTITQLAKLPKAPGEPK